MPCRHVDICSYEKLCLHRQTARCAESVEILPTAAQLWKQIQLEGKYSLESTDPRESEIRAPRQLTIALKLSCYLFIIAKLFKVKDGCLKFVYIGKKIPGLRRFWTLTSTPG